MSIFSQIRKSRQQAKEHNAKVAEQDRKEQERKNHEMVPYMHVPTHAATDAFASAPPSWREADRPRILEENRRRSAMAASGHHMNMPGARRVGSSLSHVTYPGEDATPIVRLPGAYGYTHLSPDSDRSREVVYTVPDVSYSQPASLKGKDVTRGAGYYDTLRTSPTPSKGELSSVGSSSGSTSSQDDLEMRPCRPSARPAEASHRLLPSHARRSSDASIDRLAMANSTKGPRPLNYVRDARPPPSMRGFASIAQVAAPQPMYLGAQFPDDHSQAATTSSRGSTNSASTSGTMASRQSSATSLPALTPTCSRPAASIPVTPVAAAALPTEESANWASLSNVELDMARSYDGAARVAYASSHLRYRDRRSTKTARWSELARIESTGAEPPCQDVPCTDGRREASPIAHEDLVNVFPEPVSLPEAGGSSSGKSKRFSKGGGRLVKKNRWSSTKTSTVAV